MTKCRHVYEDVGSDTCPDCGGYTHRIDWEKQNQLCKEWKAANPNAKYEGWWSI